MAEKRKNPFKGLVVTTPSSVVRKAGGVAARKKFLNALGTRRAFGFAEIRKEKVPAVMDIKRLKRGRKKR